MKWIKTYEPEIKENYVEIHYREEDEEVEHIIDYMQMKSVLMGKKDGETKLLNPADVYYFEIVERRCYAYLEQEVWNVGEGLQELVNQYGKQGFVRISKSMLVNLYKIDRLVADLNMRIQIVLENGETIMLNRSYRKEFYERLKKERMEGKENAVD